MKIDEFIVSEDITIAEAMHHLDQNGHGIVFICDEQILKAVFSDGDFRRYILQNGDMSCKIKDVANYNPYFLSMENHIDSIKFMKEKQITAVPIIDEKRRIRRIDFDNGMQAKREHKLEIPVVIMAGGRGTRLYPYTQILPKPLIPVGDKTVTEHIMERFEQAGCDEFYMIVNYKKNLIKTFFMESEEKHDIQFVDEDKFMGTGGGLKLLEGMIKQTFIMTNCDILVEEDYNAILEYHRENHNIATMICAKKNVEIPYGTVEVTESGQAVSLSEKPKFTFLTNTGLYLLEPQFLRKIPKDTFVHITDIIQMCIDEGKRVGVYTIDEEYWMDMGQLDELEKMRKRLG